MIYEPNTLNVNLELEGLDGNAYVIMNAFIRQARRDGYSQEEIEAVVKEARSGDYDHLIETIMKNCDY